MSFYSFIQDQNQNLLVEGWREKLLQRILVIAAILASFAVFPAILGTDELILQVIYIGLYVILVATTVISLPYIVKAGIFVSLPFILGISSTANSGTYGDNLFFLLAFVTISILFLGPRMGIAAITLSEVVVVGFGYLVLSDRFKLLAPLASSNELSDWATDTILFFLISAVIMGGTRMMLTSFEQIRKKNESMLDILKTSQTEMETLVAERTQELSRKNALLNATSYVTHQAATVQDLDKILNQTVHLISKHFGCYHVGIYLINQRGDFVTLQAASSEGGIRLLERGYRLRVGTEGIIGFVAAEKKPRISLDVGQDAIFFDEPELPDTRSELSLPLIARNKLVGVLDLQSTTMSAFRYDEIELFQTMADQIAVTIENTRLLTENKLVISQLETISNENTHQNWRTELSARKPSFHYSAKGVHASDKPVSLKGKNVLEVPIVLRGQKIGNISLQRKADFSKWTAQETSVANEVATQAALALENIRLVERTRQRANREQSIATVTARIRETLDLDTVLRTTAREIQKALNLQEAEVRLIPNEHPENEPNSQPSRSS